MNRSPIETLAITPKMIIRMLGGISMPSTELPATTPTENRGVWPCRIISGTATLVNTEADAIDGAGAGGEYRVGGDRRDAERAADAPQHQRRDVERVAAHVGRRHEQAHQHEHAG